MREVRRSCRYSFNQIFKPRLGRTVDWLCTVQSAASVSSDASVQPFVVDASFCPRYPYSRTSARSLAALRPESAEWQLRLPAVQLGACHLTRKECDPATRSVRSSPWLGQGRARGPLVVDSTVHRAPCTALCQPGTEHRAPRCTNRALRAPRTALYQPRTGAPSTACPQAATKPCPDAWAPQSSTGKATMFKC